MQPLLSCRGAALALLACLALGAVAPARAQAPAPAPAAKPAPTLNHAEASEVLQLLNDPQKRAAFAATLETLLKAQAVAAPKPAEAAPLAPNSIGAQVLKESSNWMSGLVAEFDSFGRVLEGLPNVWAFTLRSAENPELRARAFATAWPLALILAVAGLGEFGARRLLRGAVRRIAASVPLDAKAPPPPSPPEEPAEAVSLEDVPAPIPMETLAEEDREAAAAEQVMRGRRFSRAVKSLKRLPFVLLCFLLDLLPLGLFAALAYGGLIFTGFDDRTVLQAVVMAYAVVRVATAVTRMFAFPEQPRLRLLHMNDADAAASMLWVRRIVVVGAFGYGASQIGLIMGLPPAADNAFLKAVFLIVHLLLIGAVLRARAGVAARIRSRTPNPGIGGRVRNRFASVWHFAAIFYIAALWVVWAAEVRNGYVRIWHIFVVTVAVLIVARLTGIVLVGGLDRALRVPEETRQRFPGLEVRAARYAPWLRSALSSILVAATLLALLQVWGIDALAWFRRDALGGEVASALLTIMVAGAVAVAIWEGVNASMDRQIGRLTQQGQYARSARLRTLLPILRSILLAALVAVFGLTMLSEIGVNIAPLLAGAGILGVAIGFGSQKLVQDFITGIFLLLENAMQVGDWVTVAGLSGSVEHLSVRTMRLRAGDGSVHIIPFSSVSTVTNVNRGIGNAAVSVNVPIEEDSDHVSEVLAEIARGMRAEKRFEEMMRSDFQLWGVDKVDAGVATIVGQIVCTDAGRWGVQREFNRRMNLRFKELGIRIATPVQTVLTQAATQMRAANTGARVEDAPKVTHIAESPPPAALGNTS